MAASILLTRFAVTTVQHRYLGAYRLRIEASLGSEIENEVFLYLRGPAHPTSGDTADYFQGVASPVDMAQFPKDGPLEDATPAFFRLSYVELDFRSTQDAEDAWEDIKNEVCILLEAFDRLQDLEEVETHECGDAPAESSSLSESQSQSQSESA